MMMRVSPARCRGTTRTQQASRMRQNAQHCIFAMEIRIVQNTDEIWRLVDAKKELFEQLSDQVWDTPELCYTEFRSCAEHTAVLERQGFRVTKNVAGIPTAVVGEAGEDGPVVAILGEYDALPGLGQESGVAEVKPLPGDGHGHGCGHNLLGAASMLAATAVKDYLAVRG